MPHKIKYLYILGSVSVGTYSFAKMIEERYDPSKHLIYIPMGNKILNVQPGMAEFNNIIYPPKGFFRARAFELIMYLRAEHVIMHGMFMGQKPLLPLLLLLLLLPKTISKKLAWIEHGGDLYNWEYPHDNWKKPFLNWMNRKLRESATVVGVVHPMDEIVLRETFNTRAPCYYTQLRTVKDPFSIWESCRPKESGLVNRKRPVMVQVGHNSFQFGNHIQILEFLKKYRNNYIRLVLPMTYGMTGVFGDVYGGHHYRRAVTRLAKGMFGKKAVIMYKNIPQKNYFQYLWNVDIVVLGLQRQAALGNIHPLLYMNKKIFLPGDSVMYQWLTEQGVEVYDTNQIPNMTFEEFVTPPKGNNREWVIDFLTKNSYGLWDEFFNALDKQ